MIATHNGVFTITSKKTGQHRTFRVKTQSADSTFMPGERIVSMRDPDGIYVGFGFVETDGRITVWRSRLATYGKYVSLLENLTQYENGGLIELQAATTCRKCNKQLTSPESIRSGIGPYCAKQAVS